MKIQAINQYQRYNYVKKNNIKNKTEEPNLQNKNTNLTFKGAKGGALGILAGAATGALAAVAIVATGGLAGVVAAVGYGSTIACGAASMTHIGGIAGSIIEDKLDSKNSKK